ncbi:MAG: PAS domain S-box protein [Planctomycetes bacterium]|nr:PAS domain S-box protein [Planctomycetota bacterium]
MNQEIQRLTKLNEDLVRSIDELKSLKEIALDIFSADKLESIIESVYKFFSKNWECCGCKLFVYEETLKALISKGDEFEINDSLIQWSVDNAKPSIIPHKNENMSVMYIPLTIGIKKLGISVFLFKKKAEEFDSNATDIITVISYYVSSYLLNQELLNEEREATDYLRVLFESMPNGIITMNKERLIQFVNRNTYLFLDIHDDVVDKHISEVFPKDISDEIVNLIDSIARDGFAEELILSRKSQYGLELNFAVSCNILRIGTTNAGFIIILRDMTASKELERLRELDRLKDAFVSNVSHELKTPLTSIRAYTEALQEMATEDTQKEFLSVILEESDRLLNLINELLSVQRIQSGRIKVNYQKFDLLVLIKEVMKLLEKQSSKHKLILECPDSFHVEADYNLIKEVMINLIGNAIKYSPNGGDITIKLDINEGNIVISVKDQGIGIPKEAHDKIFQPFYRVDNSLTNTISGTGLGLSIVSSIVQAHKGKVEFESDTGKGTTFFVTLPPSK